MYLPAVPQEIWWMVCQELTAVRDFNALFNFALVSHGEALTALPLLYRIHEEASASSDDASVFGKRKLAALWRTIVLSSIGRTFYPYCLWIQNLRLGNLSELLTDIAPYPDLRDAFFTMGMDQFNVVDNNTKSTRQSRPRLNIQAITIAVGETITTFVRDAAERDNRAVALTHLEGRHIPMDLLPAWVSRLSTLVSLTIQDGSVIGGRVATAIRCHCPNFQILQCFYCDGDAVDEDMAEFFRTLAPNSLQAFSVISMNRLGEHAFRALACHSSSLRKLSLCTLQPSAFRHLGLLRPCTALTKLSFEASSQVSMNWNTEHPESFVEVVAWLKVCSLLSVLQLSTVPSATSLLSRVLGSPLLRLRELDISLKPGDGEEPFHLPLGRQTSLQRLSIRGTDEVYDLSTPQHAQLIQSISRCHLLKSLDLMDVMLITDDLWELSRTLQHLEELSFDGDDLQDDVFRPILMMPRLRSVTTSAVSNFTFEGLFEFIGKLAKAGEVREGFNLAILNQSGGHKFSAREQDIMHQMMLETIGGKLEIVYFQDPDEENEDDFSDH